MADIAMCKGEGCPMKEKCYRFKAKPCEYRQSYFAEPPIKDGKCDYFWEYNKKMDKEVPVTHWMRLPEAPNE